MVFAQRASIFQKLAAEVEILARGVYEIAVPYLCLHARDCVAGLNVEVQERICRIQDINAYCGRHVGEAREPRGGTCRVRQPASDVFSVCGHVAARFDAMECLPRHSE